MIFEHKNLLNKEGTFCFADKIGATANKVLNKEILKEFWHGHTFQCSEIDFKETDDMIFLIGEASKLSLDGNEYAINVEKTGICITAETEQGLIHGFMTLIDLIRMEEENTPEIPCCEIKEMPVIKNRMIHFCVFQQTQLWMLDRFIRFCGALKYTHIVLEFWGMYKYDCLKELSWKEGYTKEQIKPLVEMANALGIEIIPMINHWGHASSARAKYGKHVVLDQNPSLWYLFNESGWCWNIKNEKTRELLKQMRLELLDLCGNGSYFHIGCDEAYKFDYSKDSMDEICGYINDTAKDLAKDGRRTIIWGDMLLYKRESYADNGYLTTCPNAQCEEYMLSHIDKGIVIGDWQYWTKEYPVETAVTISNSGFDTILCPWDLGNNLLHCADTVKKDDLYGMMHTTWHTLEDGMEYVTKAAVLGWNESSDECRVSISASWEIATGALLRKVYFADGAYEKSGWKKDEIII